MSKCPVCGYYAYNGFECFDCGYRVTIVIIRRCRYGFNV